MTRRSPKLAKRRVDPTWFSGPEYVETFGPEVADIAALAGLPPDPEQQLFLDGLFAIRPDGKSASFENAIIGPRQVLGKTGTIKMAELGWLYVTEQKLIVHSAHELDTTEAAFNDLRELIEETPQLARHLDPTIGKVESRGITSGNGKWSIFVLGEDGRRLQVKYKARTATGGRGLTGNKIVLDEGFALTRRMVGSLYPTLTVVPDPQVLIASSGGLLDSAVLRDVRDRGRAKTDPRLLYAEWGDDVAKLGGCKLAYCDHAKPPNNRPGCVLDDPRRWRLFMTTLGRRTTEETVRDMRGSMPPDEFAREFMVWWEDPPNADSDGVLDLTRWGKLKDESAPRPTRAVVTIDVAPNRKSASVAVAGDAPGGRTLVMVTSKPGITWIKGAVVKLRDRRDLKVLKFALRPNSQAGALLGELTTAGVDVDTIPSVQQGQACAAFVVGVNEKAAFAHVGQKELDKAVANAITRWNGEVENWDRRDPRVDISPVVAAGDAAYLWSLVPKQKPPAPRKVGDSAGPKSTRPRRSSVATAGF